MTIEQDIVEIQRHIEVLNHNSTEMAINIARIAERVDMLMWLMGAIVIALIATIVPRAVKVLLNGKKVG